MPVKKRPKHLDLIRIRLPLAGVVSIMHRVSGAILFLFIPLLLWLLQLSLASPQSFDAFRNAASNPLLKIVLLGLLWGYLHHLCAGVRHLALDLDLGTELGAARLSSAIVIVVSIGLTLMAGALLW
ncbi:MAG: succinate dehydrogenase, cytochrome b556 subunit [Burkholderiales bacterium]|nr:succinate dehydrogenase, cytochrome b556 subunit [Burkholderiales bacterium]